MLNQPICYSDAAFGEVQKAAIIALVGDDISTNFYGKFVRVRGLISKTVTADQPPQELMLFQANVEPRK
jgi:hypothetical protein